MARLRKVSIVLLLLIGVGLLRMPLERPLGRELRAQGLIEKPLDLRTTESLGQTSAVIALGGLRTLVAAVLNFSKVVPAWDDRDWLGVFDIFQDIHTLQPRTAYYWEAAAGYAADDAYSDYRDRTDVEEWQRKLRRQEFFEKGVSYLDQGIGYLPENTDLRALKARFYSDTHKAEQQDFGVATEILDEAVELPAASDVLKRQRLYSMVRVPERHREALDLVREIFQDPRSRFPSIKSLLFTLQQQFPEATDGFVPREEIYTDDAEMIRSLFNYYQRREENFPMVGVRETLQETLRDLDLPYQLDPLRNPDLKRLTESLTDVLAAAPLRLPADPFATESDWATIVTSFEENGNSAPSFSRAAFYVLQNLAEISEDEKVPIGNIFPDKLYAIRDLANYLQDESHQFPHAGEEETIRQLALDVGLPKELNPLEDKSLFPLTMDWIRQVRAVQQGL